MPWEVLEISAPYLAVLVYLLVNAVLTVLCDHRRRAVEMHDRVRQARLLRRQYLEALQNE